MTDPQFPPLEQLRRFGFSWDSVVSFGPYLDFWSFYQTVVQAAPHGSTIVELGAYHGQSLICLGLFAREADKGLRIVGIDNNSVGANPLLRENLAKAGLADYVTFIEGDSASAASQFADESVWLVFVDSGHLHELVEADIRAWMPKVTHWLAGHDFLMWVVHQPVLNLLADVIYNDRWQDIWIARKQPVLDADIRLVPADYPTRREWEP